MPTLSAEILVKLLACILFSVDAKLTGRETFQNWNQFVRFYHVHKELIVCDRVKLIGFDFEPDGAPVVLWIDKVDVNGYLVLPSRRNSILDLDKSGPFYFFTPVRVCNCAASLYSAVQVSLERNRRRIR